MASLNFGDQFYRKFQSPWKREGAAATDKVVIALVEN